MQERHFRFGEHTDGGWSNCLDGQRANYLTSGDPYEVDSRPHTTPVGFYNGELHYKADFGWPGSATGPGSGPGRVLRGGDWDVSQWLCRSAFRLVAWPVGRSEFFGFRCALGAP